MGKKSRRIKPKKERMPFVARTFAGLPSEGDWIALREFVPAATAQIALANSGQTVQICSLLPGGGAGIVRADGDIWVGLQVLHNYGDVSRDLAHVIELAQETEPGNPIKMTDPGVGPRLQDLIAPDSTFDVTVHDGFDFWIDNIDQRTAAALEQANETASPTTKLSSVDAAYVSVVAGRTYLRWVLTSEEAPTLDALARLHARGDSNLTNDTRLLGMFRAHGLLVPVWELHEATADDIESPVASLQKQLLDAIADNSELTADERAARQGLTNRQLTIR